MSAFSILLSVLDLVVPVVDSRSATLNPPDLGVVAIGEWLRPLSNPGGSD